MGFATASGAAASSRHITIAQQRDRARASSAAAGPTGRDRCGGCVGIASPVPVPHRIRRARQKIAAARTAFILDEQQLDTAATSLSTFVASAHFASSLPSGGTLGIISATEDSQFAIAADLRATAFYDDLKERQALAFPPRFLPTFHREFAQREVKALRERTVKPSGSSLRCVCLMAREKNAPSAEAGESYDDGDDVATDLVGCLDVSERRGPCVSQLNGCVVSAEEHYAYVDNVAVDARARRRGAASLLLHAASAVATTQFGASDVYTHVHVDNTAARVLYHCFGFRAPSGGPMPEGSAGKAWKTERLSGLLLLKAPLPLVREKKNDEGATEIENKREKECACGAAFPGVRICVCGGASSSAAARAPR